MNDSVVPVANDIALLTNIASSIDRTSIVGIEIDLKMIAIRMNIERIESTLVSLKSWSVMSIKSLYIAPSPVT